MTLFFLEPFPLEVKVKQRQYTTLPMIPTALNHFRVFQLKVLMDSRSLKVMEMGVVDERPSLVESGE